MRDEALLALHEAADALLVAQAALLSAQRVLLSESTTKVGCSHPAEARADISTPGSRGFLCRLCGQIVEDSEHGEAGTA
jgi:hypothetical protein